MVDVQEINGKGARDDKWAKIVNDTGYVPLTLKGIHDDLEPMCDLYIEVSGRHVLYRTASRQFTRADRDRLLSVGVPHLWIRIPTADDNHPQQHLATLLSLSDEAVSPVQKAGLAYNSALASYRRIITNHTSADTMLDLDESITGIVDYVVKNRTAFRALLFVMLHDFRTYAHSVNVAVYALGLGRFSGIRDSQMLRNLGLGAFLHDIGKIRVPTQVLNKNGALTPDEWLVMRQHPVWGTEILSSSNFASEVLTTISQHHEGLDGSGYPNGLGGSELHSFSKIVSLVDAYDALTSKRPYRAASTPYQALSSLKQETMGKFDGELFTNLVRLLGCPSPVSNT